MNGVELSGLSPAQAKSALIAHWKVAREIPIRAHEDARLDGIPEATPAELGIEPRIDDTVAKLPRSSYGSRVLQRIGLQHPSATRMAMEVTVPADAGQAFAEKVAAHIPGATPAKAELEGTTIKLSVEKPKLTLEVSKFGDELLAAFRSGGPLKLDLVESKKHVPDDALKRISTVIGHYATNFSSGPSRTNNIRVASGMLNGHVVMPGEKFSFNQFLGQRTEDKGFKRAGIYLNGHHDFDTGGGVCQVSTTLYNTVLQAGLDVVSRQPHSMPVAYVPLGQDAAVSYPGLDFAFRNDRDYPVAIATKYRPGRIEFSLLGETKRQGVVRIENKLLRTFPPKTVTESNPALPSGTRRMKEHGSQGREVESWRVVSIDGKTHRENLGISHYAGGAVVIEVGTGSRRSSAPKSIAAKNLSASLVHAH